jgi:hypothetical protein
LHPRGRFAFAKGQRKRATKELGKRKGKLGQNGEQKGKEQRKEEEGMPMQMLVMGVVVVVALINVPTLPYSRFVLDESRENCSIIYFAPDFGGREGGEGCGRLWPLQ